MCRIKNPDTLCNSLVMFFLSIYRVLYLQANGMKHHHLPNNNQSLFYIYVTWIYLYFQRMSHHWLTLLYCCMFMLHTFFYVFRECHITDSLCCIVVCLCYIHFSMFSESVTSLTHYVVLLSVYVTYTFLCFQRVSHHWLTLLYCCMFMLHTFFYVFRECHITDSLCCIVVCLCYIHFSMFSESVTSLTHYVVLLSVYVTYIFLCFQRVSHHWLTDSLCCIVVHLCYIHFQRVTHLSLTDSLRCIVICLCYIDLFCIFR